MSPGAVAKLDPLIGMLIDLLMQSTADDAESVSAPQNETEGANASPP